MHSIESMIGELNIEDNTNSISQADTRGCDSESSSSSGSRAVQFSELVMTVPPEINGFCLSILWTLKDKGVVQSWYWEEGVLRVWADADLIFSRSTNCDCGGYSPLARLIEATQYREAYPAPLPDAFKITDDVGTDFSFLGCDISQTLIPLA